MAIAAMPTTGWSRWVPATDPKKRVSPNEKMPPSAADEPIAVTGRRRGDADNRPVQVTSTHRSEEARVAEREDAAVGCDEPIAVTGRGRGDADNRPVQVTTTHRSEEARVAEREDAAVGRDEPVAVTGAVAAMPTIGWFR